MSFCTVINCMDGRVQLPVIHYLQKRFNVDDVDSITDAGPNLILAEQQDKSAVQWILKKLNISVEKHGSVGVAIVGHYDCAGNPAVKADQIIHTQRAMRFIGEKHEDIPVIGLWVDDAFTVHEIDDNSAIPK